MFPLLLSVTSLTVDAALVCCSLSFLLYSLLFLVCVCGRPLSRLGHRVCSSQLRYAFQWLRSHSFFLSRSSKTPPPPPPPRLSLTLTLCRLISIYPLFISPSLFLKTDVLLSFVSCLSPPSLFSHTRLLSLSLSPVSSLSLVSRSLFLSLL